MMTMRTSFTTKK